MISERSPHCNSTWRVHTPDGARVGGGMQSSVPPRSRLSSIPWTLSMLSGMINELRFFHGLLVSAMKTMNID